MVSPWIAFLERLAAACGEDLILDARAREVPFDPSQLDARLAIAPEDRAELSFSRNKLAGELSLAEASAR